MADTPHPIKELACTNCGKKTIFWGARLIEWNHVAQSPLISSEPMCIKCIIALDNEKELYDCGVNKP